MDDDDAPDVDIDADLDLNPGLDDERDDLTLSMFGDEPAAPAVSAVSASGSPYLVLARKYRPTRFEDLIGQEAMVKTLANAFALDRIAQAYMLTGVRGVGKTTTARLIARALNYRSPTQDRPTVVLDPPGEHCAAIQAGSHPDVYELDAASRTGVDDMRELLDGVRYGPLTARYKVYIIDEVHMLSIHAFNALLKTLEEPPPHAKFVFATTEIRKVPVTVLSRCQRFDLRRIEPDTLAAHLAKVCANEGANVDAEGLELIARAAEGSVRDGLSLLDQAIVQDQGAGVHGADVRDMLGLADRGRTLDALDAVLKGEARHALAEFRAQYDRGADAGVFLRDLMDCAHEVARVQAMGEAWKPAGPSDQVARLRGFADAASPAALSRIWQMLLRGFEEAGRAPDPVQAAEMCLLRLCAAQRLPSPEDLARMLADAPAPRDETPPHAPGPSGAGIERAPPPWAQGSGGAVAVARAEPAARPSPTTLEAAIAMLESQREVAIAADLERFARVNVFEPGRMVFELRENGPKDLQRRAAEALTRLTGRPWSVEVVRGAGGETLHERGRRLEEETREAIKAEPLVAEALRAFPGARVLEVRDPPSAPAGAEGSVVTVDFAARRATS